MAHVEYDVTINRPMSHDFEFVQNGENNPLWRKSHLDVENVTDASLGVGTYFKQGLKGPRGWRMNGIYEIKQSRAGERVVIQVKTAPVRPTNGTYEFKQMAGSTAVKFTLDHQLKGLLRFLAPMIDCLMRVEVDGKYKPFRLRSLHCRIKPS